jgi:UDP-glucose 4-epimerase
VNYLVVGGGGYLGSHLVEQLIGKNHHVFILDNDSGNLVNRIGGSTEYIFGDITNKMHLKQLNNYPKFDGVFHLAAKKSVPESILNPTLYEKVNFLGTQNLIDYCKRNGVSNVVYTSSAAVYGQTDPTFPIHESMLTQPINPYGLTKLQGERILESASNAGAISGFSLRIFNIVGSAKPTYFDEKGENVIPIMLSSLMLKRTFTIFGKNLETKDGSCVRDYVNVSDVAKAHIDAMSYLHNCPKGSYKVANISSSTGTSMLELLDVLNNLSDVQLKWQYGSKRPGDPISVIGDNVLAHVTLGWRPTKNIYDGIKESLHAILAT